MPQATDTQFGEEQPHERMKSLNSSRNIEILEFQQEYLNPFCLTQKKPPQTTGKALLCHSWCGRSMNRLSIPAPGICCNSMLFSKNSNPIHPCCRMSEGHSQEETAKEKSQKQGGNFPNPAVPGNSADFCGFPNPTRTL